MFKFMLRIEKINSQKEHFDLNQEFSFYHLLSREMGYG